MFNITLRIKSIILAISLFLVGLIYGDAPIEVDYTVYINGTEISSADSVGVSVGEELSITCSCENIGRPFEGEDLYYPMMHLYKTENGEKVYLDLLFVGVPAEPNPILIKKEEKFDCSNYFIIEEDAEPGVYTLVVKVYGCEKVFEDILTVK